MTDLAHIRHLLLVQDNAGTSDPVFVVQRRVRVYGFDDRYHEATDCWVNSEEEVTSTAERSTETGDGWTFKRLEQNDLDGNADPEGWMRRKL